MGAHTSRFVDEKFAKADELAGPTLLDITKQFLEWTLDDVKELRVRYLKTKRVTYQLVYSQFADIVSFMDVKRPKEVFELLDDDRNGRVDALQLIGGLAICSRGTFDDKAKFCFELVDFNLNGSLSRLEMVFMMKNCVYGLLNLLGECVGVWRRS